MDTESTVLKILKQFSLDTAETIILFVDQTTIGNFYLVGSQTSVQEVFFSKLYN